MLAQAGLPPCCQTEAAERTVSLARDPSSPLVQAPRLLLYFALLVARSQAGVLLEPVMRRLRPGPECSRTGAGGADRLFLSGSGSQTRLQPQENKIGQNTFSLIKTNPSHKDDKVDVGSKYVGIIQVFVRRKRLERVRYDVTLNRMVGYKLCC